MESLKFPLTQHFLVFIVLCEVGSNEVDFLFICLLVFGISFLCAWFSNKMDLFFCLIGFLKIRKGRCHQGQSPITPSTFPTVWKDKE